MVPFQHSFLVFIHVNKNKVFKSMFTNLFGIFILV